MTKAGKLKNKKNHYRHPDTEIKRRKYKTIFIMLSIALLLTACGGDDNGDGDGGAPPSLPILTLDSPSISEQDSGSNVLTFTATLSKLDAAEVTVDYTTTDVTAIQGVDFEAATNTITIPIGATSATLDINIFGDIVVENDETFTLILSNISSNATLGTTTAVGTIVNDDEQVVEPPDPQPSSSVLNDTGVTNCSSDFVNGLNCNSSSDGTDQYIGQDAEHGRDVTDNDDSDGYAGFSFTKLDGNGDALSDQTTDYATAPWRCVQDQITGLMWEIKTNDDGLQDRSWTYSWYFFNGISSTINNGTAGYSNNGECVDDQNCDTQKYLNAVNAAQLCNYDDWRLPSRRELLSIMHFGADTANYIDTNFFVNHVQFPYWSDSTGWAFDAYFVEYSSIGARGAAQSDDYAVRLVRGGQ